MEKRDYYEVLGVERDADPGAIKSAYRRCAMEHHPDRNPGDHRSEERFKEAAEAYEVLSSPEKRALYDQYGHAGARQAGFGGFQGMDDILSHFADIFGMGFGGRQRAREPQVGVRLTFMEAVKGCTKELAIERDHPCERCSGSGAKPGTQPSVCPTCGGRGQVMQSMGFVRIASGCPTCRGQGRVVKERCDACGGHGVVQRSEKVSLEIPAGVDDGDARRVQMGRGQPFVVAFAVQPDPRWEREGTELLTEVPIRYAQAVLGGKVAVPTIEGEELVEIEPGTQTGTVKTLRGRGVPRVGSRGRGDLHARFHVVVPTRLTDEQRRAIEQLDAAFPAAPASPTAAADPEEEERGFFGRRKKRK
jgi:molecular chaperone DnaJ